MAVTDDAVTVAPLSTLPNTDALEAAADDEHESSATAQADGATPYLRIAGSGSGRNKLTVLE